MNEVLPRYGQDVGCGAKIFSVAVVAVSRWLVVPLRRYLERSNRARVLNLADFVTDVRT
jgi:hypothetical protein